MDGRGLLAVSEGREQIRMRDDAGALLRIERDALEAVAGDAFAIELREALVEQQVIGLEQLAIVRALAPHDLIEEELERRAQVGEHRGVEVGEGLRIFGDRLRALEFQPVVEEAAQLRLRARIAEHARRLARRSARGCCSFPSRRGLQQLLGRGWNPTGAARAARRRRSRPAARRRGVPDRESAAT